MDAGRPLPESFAELILRVLDPADADEAAALIVEATSLPDPELAAFLDTFTARVRASPAPLRAAEIRTWLGGTSPAA